MFLNFGELSKSQWEHNKLVVQSHGFESYTDVPPDDDTNPWFPPDHKYSLHVGLRMDGSEWKNVTILHPRNHPSAIVIPLNETLEEFVENKTGDSLGELEVKILGTDDHYIDFVGIDDSVPAEPTKVQEAALTSALLNGETDVTEILREGNEELVSIIPGEHIILTFEIPKQSPAPVFNERNFMLFTRGYYELYDDEVFDEKGSPDDAELVVKDQHNFHAYEKAINPPSSYLDDHLKGYGNELYVQVPTELHRYLLNSRPIRSTLKEFHDGVICYGASSCAEEYCVQK